MLKFHVFARGRPGAGDGGPAATPRTILIELWSVSPVLKLIVVSTRFDAAFQKDAELDLTKYKVV